MIPLDQLVPFKDHPFKVIDDESMMDTVQSIREHGILLPLIVSPMPDGKYEIVSGHRRSHAGKLAGGNHRQRAIHAVAFSGATSEALFAGRQTDRRYGAGDHVRTEKAGNRKGRAAKQTDIPIFLPVRNAERNGNLRFFPCSIRRRNGAPISRRTARSTT